MDRQRKEFNERHRQVTTVKRFLEIYDRIEAGLAGFCMLASLSICFMEVITRYCFSYSAYWAQEYILYFMVWAIFLGTSSVLKKDKHVRLELFVGLMPPKIRKFWDIVCYVIILVFGVFFFISGIQTVRDSYVRHYVSTSLAKTPIWIPQLILPISGVTFTFRAIEHLVKKLSRRQDEGLAENKEVAD